MYRKKILLFIALMQLVCCCVGYGQFEASDQQRIAELEQAVQRLTHVQNHDQAYDQSQATLYTGFSFLFARLEFHESFRAMETNIATGTLNLIPFDYSFELTPRVWLGYQWESGLGVRSTFWQFDQADDGLTRVNDGTLFPSATSTTVIFPALITAVVPGDQLHVGTSLDAATVDLEATYNARIKCLEMLFSGGLRYAKAEQRFDASVSGVVPASLNWSREFEGLGPTMGVTGKLPFGKSGFYGTGSARLAFLFGEKTLARSVVNDMTPTPAPPFVRLTDADEVTGTYAAGVGLGWQKRTDLADYFVEGAYEGQLWTAGGAPTLTFLGFNGLSLNLGLAL